MKPSRRLYAKITLFLFVSIDGSEWDIARQHLNKKAVSLYQSKLEKVIVDAGRIPGIYSGPQKLESTNTLNHITMDRLHFFH